MKIKVCFSYPSPRSPQALFKGLLGPGFRAPGGVSTGDLGRLQTLYLPVPTGDRQPGTPLTGLSQGLSDPGP